jgi:hypothetical protein
VELAFGITNNTAREMLAAILEDCHVELEGDALRVVNLDIAVDFVDVILVVNRSFL